MTSASDLRGLREWRCIGPMRAGRVVAVAGDPSDPATFYFGGAAGGVFKTTDAGTTWRAVSDGFFKTSAVGALEVAPADPQVIYAGMGETTIRLDVSHGDGVYKSTDGGASWQHVGLAATRHIGKVRTDPRNADIVFVAAFGHAFGPNPERGVFRSSNGGRTWQQVLHVSDTAGAVDLSIDQQNPRFVYAAFWQAYRSFWQISSGGPGSGLWMSSDGGTSWTDISGRPGLPSRIWGKVAVSASPAQSGRVWALIEHQPEGGLYRSDDYGRTWEKVSANQHLLSRAWYYIHLTADSTDADRVYVNNLALWVSNDGGRNFSEIRTPHGDNHDLWIDPRNNRRMIQGNDGGANISLNGALSWSSVYNQPTAQFYHLATDNRIPYNIYGTQQDNSSLATPSRTRHPGIRWEDSFVAGSGESGYIAVDPRDSDIVYIGAIGSSPGGGNCLQRFDRRSGQLRLVTTWPEMMRGDGTKALRYRFAWTYPILISSHNPAKITIGGNQVWRTTNEGQTWQPISPDLTRNDPTTMEPSGGPINRDAVSAEIYATVFALAESPLQEGLFWAGSDDGLVHISRDDGASWQNITPPDFADWMLVSGLEPSPFDAGTCYMACTRYKLDDPTPYLYKTTDYGTTWTRIDHGIPRDDFTRVIRADHVREGLLFAGSETQVYVSFDDGANWQSLQQNLPAAPIYEILIKDNDLIVGTHGRSIWIMDDITPLRDLPAEVSGNVLGSGGPMIRPLLGVDFAADGPGKHYGTTTGGIFINHKLPHNALRRENLDMGSNPPAGAVISYRLAAPAQQLTLVINDGAGNELRRFVSKKDDKDDKQLRLPNAAGWNRFVWDTRIASAAKVKGSDPISEAEFVGPRVVPGNYPIVLTVDDAVLHGNVTIISEPSINTPQEDLAAQFALGLQVHQLIDHTVATVNLMRDVRAQLTGWEARADGRPHLSERCRQLREQLLEIEKTLAVPDLRPGWGDAFTFGARLLERIAELPAVIELGDYRPTDAAVAVYHDLKRRIDEQIERFDDLKAEELPTLNAALHAAGFGIIA